MKKKLNENVLDPINTSLNSMQTAVFSDATMVIKDIVDQNSTKYDTYD